MSADAISSCRSSQPLRSADYSRVYRPKRRYDAGVTLRMPLMRPPQRAAAKYGDAAKILRHDALKAASDGAVRAERAAEDAISSRPRWHLYAFITIPPTIPCHARLYYADFTAMLRSRVILSERRHMLSHARIDRRAVWWR